MVRHTCLFWGVRTEWASNLVCSSQHGFVGQLCFSILQRWKVNDTECQHMRKEKSTVVKERRAFSNLEIHVQASYATDKDAKCASACWELERMCQPRDCLSVHLENADWVIRGQVEDPASVGGTSVLQSSPPPPQLGRGRGCRRELTALPGRLYRLQFQAPLSLLDQDPAIK